MFLPKQTAQKFTFIKNYSMRMHVCTNISNIDCFKNTQFDIKNVSTNLIKAIDYVLKKKGKIFGILGKKDGYTKKKDIIF